MRQTSLPDVIETLRRSRRVLAFCHVSPDGDAIGSLLGLDWILRDLPLAAGSAGQAERVIALVCNDNVPPEYLFLPGASSIRSTVPQGPWDCVVSLDSSDASRLGDAFRPGSLGDAPLINIDHHVTNLLYGDLNLVDASAAATSQVLVQLATEADVPLSRQVAVCLLTGIVTDTLSFRTSNVTPAVLQAAARLVQAGASMSEIVDRTLNYRPLASMRLWGFALSRLESRRGVVWASISREMQAEAGLPEDGEGGLSSFLISAPEANIAAVFTERPDGQVEIGFRSRPEFDVAQVALALGGGGHPQAAGCTVVGPMPAAQARVIAMLEALSGAERRPAPSSANA